MMRPRVIKEDEVEEKLLESEAYRDTMAQRRFVDKKIYQARYDFWMAEWARLIEDNEIDYIRCMHYVYCKGYIDYVFLSKNKEIFRDYKDPDDKQREKWDALRDTFAVFGDRLTVDMFGEFNPKVQNNV